jgi:hypothetical protein
MNDLSTLKLLELLLNGGTPAEKKDSVKFMKNAMKMKVPNDLNFNWIKRLAKQPGFERCYRKFAEHVVARQGFPPEIENKIRQITPNGVPETKQEFIRLLRQGLEETVKAHPEMNPVQKKNYVICLLIHYVSAAPIPLIAAQCLPDYYEIGEDSGEFITKMMEDEPDEDAGEEPASEAAPTEEPAKADSAPAKAAADEPK